MKTLLTQRRRIIEIDENFLIEILELKQQYLIIDLNFANFDIYHDKNFKKFKN